MERLLIFGLGGQEILFIALIVLLLFVAADLSHPSGQDEKYTAPDPSG